MPKKRTAGDSGAALSGKKLRALVEEATVDANGEDEQRMGFLTMIVDNLTHPFVTTVLGMPVTVHAIEMAGDDNIVAVCVRGRDRQRISILELPLPTAPPRGWEWIEAYRHWANP